MKFPVITKKHLLFFLKIILSLFLTLHIALFASTCAKVRALRTENPARTSVMDYRGHNGKQPEFLPLGKIPPPLIRTILAIEDTQFYQHPGFTLRAIFRAMELNRKAGYPVYGGSTITQQLARTLFLNPEKNYLRKYLELCLAVELEIFLKKQRILELYLNYAEWGKNVYGVKDAAMYHFKKELKDTSPEEQILLITLLASPVIHTPENCKDTPLMAARYQAVKSYYEKRKELPLKFKSTIEKK